MLALSVKMGDVQQETLQINSNASLIGPHIPLTCTCYNSNHKVSAATGAKAWFSLATQAQTQ